MSEKAIQQEGMNLYNTGKKKLKSSALVLIQY